MPRHPREVRGYVRDGAPRSFRSRIVALALALSLPRLTTPAVYVFDELYYAYTAGKYVAGDEAYSTAIPPRDDPAIEWTHPPLAKLLIAGGILVAGDNPLGWRIASVVFGVAGVLVAYFLALSTHRQPCHERSGRRAAPDGWSVPGRVTDRHVQPVRARLRQWRPARVFPRSDRVTGARGTATPGNGPVPWAWHRDEMERHRPRRPHRAGRLLADVPALASRARDEPEAAADARAGLRAYLRWAPIALVVLPLAIYLASYLHFWLTGHNWADFVALHRDMLAYHRNLGCRP